LHLPENIIWDMVIIAADYAPGRIEGHGQRPKAEGHTYCKVGSPAIVPFISGLLPTVFTMSEAHFFTLIHLAF
jgi:hypothetical protein